VGWERGLRERDNGGDVNNVQCKSNWNCHYESPPYNEYILIKKLLKKKDSPKGCPVSNDRRESTQECPDYFNCSLNPIVQQRSILRYERCIERQWLVFFLFIKVTAFI
jgi:hypothetical protein